MSQSLEIPLLTAAPLRTFKKIFNVETVDGLGSFNRAELSSMGAIIEYLQITQKGKLHYYQDQGRTKYLYDYRYSN